MKRDQENNKNENNNLVKIGATVAGALGLSLIGYIIYDFLNKRKRKSNNNVDTGDKEELTMKGDNVKAGRQVGEERGQMTDEDFVDAKMDTLVQTEIEFPSGYWSEGEFADWKDTRNKIFKRCFCGKCAEKEKLQICGKCKGVFYCGREHQVESWSVRGHKVFCTKLQSSSNVTFSAFKRMLIENSPPINRSEFATEDSLSLVLKRLFDGKYESELEEATLLKEVGRLTWMLAQMKYNNKPNNTDFLNMMDLSFTYLQNAWNKKDSLDNDLELKSQIEWLMGEHYMTKNIGKGCFLLYHSVLDMLSFHARLVDKLKIEETKKLIQIWIAALIERLMQAEFIDQATNVLAKILIQAEHRQDIEWQIQTLDLQCLLQAFVRSKEKNLVVELSPTSSFTKDMQRFYEDIKKENTRIAELEKLYQQNPPQGMYGNQQFSPEDFERMMRTYQQANN